MAEGLGTAIGFCVVIGELIRIAHALEEDQASQVDLGPVEESPAEAGQLQPA